MQQAGQAVAKYTEVTGTAFLVSSVVKLLIVFVAVLVIVAMLTLLERKVSAWMQDRLGPNRVGPGGLLQPAADGLKNILKEESNPGEVNKVFFTLAPMLSITPAMVTFAVIPIAAPLYIEGVGVIPMMIADLPVGILFLLAFSSLGVYGIVVAGWASSNKYALLGGLRAGAQMISYEIALGLSLMSVFFLVGNVGLDEIVYAQQRMNLWFALPLSVSFFFFWISSFAETNRLPFDLPEAESELVTGYHTEYSAMKFSMFFIAEYSHVLVVSALMATLFLGGWDIPGWQGDDMAIVNGVLVGATPAIWITVLTLFAFLLKTFFFIMVFMLVRWTVPRFRYDQVMDLGWKIMLPVALAVVVVTAATVLALDSAGAPFVEVLSNGARGSFTVWGGLVLTAVNAVMLFAVLWLMDKGHTLAGTGSMEDKRTAARERSRKRAEAMRVHLTTPRAGVR